MKSKEDAIEHCVRQLGPFHLYTIQRLYVDRHADWTRSISSIGTGVCWLTLISAYENLAAFCHGYDYYLRFFAVDAS